AGAAVGVSGAGALGALVALESDGAVFRGTFTPEAGEQWCDRRLLARMHRLTLNRLRGEIEPLSPAAFVRFLLAWQHLTPETRLSGLEGLRVVLSQLDGYELAAGAWERHVLPARVAGYDPSMLDMLCFSGEVAWARLSGGARSAARLAGAKRPLRSTPVAIFPREHWDVWTSVDDETGLPVAQPDGD